MQVEFLTPAKAAQTLQVHRTTVTRMCQRGLIKAMRLPAKSKAHWRIEREEIDRLLRG